MVLNCLLLAPHAYCSSPWSWTVRFTRDECAAAAVRGPEMSTQCMRVTFHGGQQACFFTEICRHFLQRHEHLMNAHTEENCWVMRCSHGVSKQAFALAVHCSISSWKNAVKCWLAALISGCLDPRLINSPEIVAFFIIHSPSRTQVWVFFHSRSNAMEQR